jgi:AcrR family transcriptional regulator
MDAAEVLFAEHGLSGTSVRMIVSEVGANVASIRFHFGSLEALKRAVLMRRFEPLVARRLHDLEQARADAGGPLEVVAILSIWFAPMQEMLLSKEPGERAFPRILARMLMDRDPSYKAMLEDELDEHVRAFVDELARALPRLSRRELGHRFDFTIGAFGHALNRVSDVSVRGARQRRYLERITAELLTYAGVGLEAPPTAIR